MCDSSIETIPFWKSIKFYSLIIAIFAFVASGYAIYCTEKYRSSAPDITVYEPTGYSISRGLFSFPSDHLIIPIGFENSGGKNAIIRHPSLKLKNKSTGEDHVFYLAGEFHEISTKSFQDKYGYELKNSFIIEPHSISLKYLVFHIKDWWDTKSKTYNFNFKGQDCYNIRILYQVNQEPFVEKQLIDVLPIFGSADNLNLEKDYWWDYWPLHEDSCK